MQTIGLLSELIVFSLIFTVLSKPLKWSDPPNPDNTIPTCQLAASKGYPCEEYNVTTTDGYILTIHRLPYGIKSPGNNATLVDKPVTYLQHGLLDCSATWVINYPNESLGFMLADAGYDVWLGNMRGNTYGLNHVNMIPNQDEFWQFSFDQMAKYDLPSIVEYILSKTNQPDLYYIGHSQGTLIGFIQFSQNFEWAETKIKQFHALAPIAYLGHTTSPWRYIAPFSNEVELLCKIFGFGEFLPSNAVLQFFGKNICSPPFEFLCTDSLQLFCGYDAANMNYSRESVYMTHAPAGTSTYNMLHFGQLMHTKNFQAMNWGYFQNIKLYGSHTPPLYNVTSMTVPTVLYSGSIDEFADPIDVALLQPQIKNLIGNFTYAGMDHLDFVWGMNAAKEPYPRIMQIIEQSMKR